MKHIGIEGKQIMMWLPYEHIGQPATLVQLCIDLKLTRVSIKVANGNYLYTNLQPYVTALRAAGISVAGWHYLYSGVKFPDPKKPEWVWTNITPEQEAEVTKDAILLYGLDAIELDVEKEFKVGNQQQRAERYMAALLPCPIPVGLCTYRFPDLHQEIPWQTFLTYENGVDYVNPQVYWGVVDATHGPVPELKKSYAQYQALFKKYGSREYFPVGRNYYGDGYPVPPAGSPGTMAKEIDDFLTLANNECMPAASFWALDFFVIPTHAAGREERKKAIADFWWITSLPPKPPPLPAPFEFVADAGVNVRSEPGTSGGDATVAATPIKSRKFKAGREVLGTDGKTWYEAKVYIRADLCHKV